MTTLIALGVVFGVPIVFGNLAILYAACVRKARSRDIP